MKRIIIFLLVIYTITVLPFLIETRENKESDILSHIDNITVNITKDNNYELYPMTDEYALNNLSNNVLTINNNDNSEKTYKLVLKVSKDTTIELNNIKFKVEDNIIELDNTSYEDNDNYYYEFNPSSLHKNEKININYILWLDENIKELTGNDLIYSFEVKTI